MKLSCAFVFAGVCAGAAWAANSSAISKVLDGQVKMVESEVVPLAEAMPADKYGFAPTHGEFKGVRTFGQQVSHIAWVINAVSASVLGEPVPDTGKAENGPDSLHSKEEIVKYLKDAFAYAHKAMLSVTDQNVSEKIKSAFGKDMVPRLSMATVPVWHTFDHYGQMVVYGRMNGIVPPASRR